MTRLISQLFFFLSFVFSSSLFGQGRVDNDPILHSIWWATYKIDSDTNLICTINSSSNQKGLTKIVACYSKKDTIYKIIEVTTIPSGTKMTNYYFRNSKPIYISVAKNSYLLSGERKEFFKAVNSFNDIVDTNFIQQKQLYKNFYQASYYFYHDSVSYANIMTKNIIRVDNRKDKDEGLKLYYQWKKLIMTKQ